jgi:MFS family permease
VLAVAYTISFADRQILSLLVAPLRQDLGLSDTQISFLQGLSFSAFYLGLSIPLARLADRGNRVRLIAIGMAIWCAMTALGALARDFPTLFATRMGVGLGEAALTPAALSLLGDYFRRDQLPLVVTLYSLALSVGGGLAYVGGGYVVGWATGGGALVVPGLGTLHSWQTALLAIGGLGLLWLPFVAALPEPRQASGRERTMTQTSLAEFLRRERRTFLPFLAGFASLTLFAIGALAWTPALLQRVHGFSAQEAGLAYGSILLGCGSVGPLLGSLLARFWTARGVAGATLKMIVWAVALSLPMIWSWTLTGNTAFCLVALAAANLLMSATLQGPPAAVIQQWAAPGVRARATALYFFSINIVGLILGPTVVALLTDRLFGDPADVGRSLALTASVCLIVGAIAIHTARRRMGREI